MSQTNAAQAEDSCAHRVFAALWKKYTDLVIDARSIEQSLRSKGDVWNEDHVAFRTFPGEHTGMHILQSVFEALGYRRKDDYFFEDKQLKAFWLEPPLTHGRKCSEVAPKIFVSELILDKFPTEFQEIVKSAARQVKASPVKRIQALASKVKNGDRQSEDELVAECIAFLSSGAGWHRPCFNDYELLRKSSEYAAWTLVFGNNINHFTVSVQLMASFKDIHSLNAHIVNDLKIPMNSTGGITKGTPELRLEQSSTLAVQLPVLFQEGIKTLPYAFVEFAYRYPLEGNRHDANWNSYYQGFVINNADKIFESTNLR
ncbi:MAG: DUF1338 domain-containing protein [Proteobacteria bacterium]|nr:DUF1338 domain-containing protein [Pseudomonadota bacterium]